MSGLAGSCWKNLLIFKQLLPNNSQHSEHGLQEPHDGVGLAVLPDCLIRAELQVSYKGQCHQIAVARFIRLDLATRPGRPANAVVPL